MSLDDIRSFVSEERTEGIRPFMVRDSSVSTQIDTDEGEERSWEDRQFEDEDMVVSGQASVFDSPATISTPFEEFEEVVRPGAFAKTIQENDVRALWNHETSFPLGRQSAGTLELNESDTGLDVEHSLPESPMGQNAFEAIRRGDVQGMSIGFDVIKEEWTEPAGRDDADIPLREIFEIRLHEVSEVTFPAFPQTSIEPDEETSLREKLRFIEDEVGIRMDKVINTIYRNADGVFTDEERDLVEKELGVFFNRGEGEDQITEKNLKTARKRLSLYDR